MNVEFGLVIIYSSHTHTHTHARTHAHVCMHARTHMRTHTCMHARTHTPRTHTHARTHARMRVRTHTHTHSLSFYCFQLPIVFSIVCIAKMCDCPTEFGSVVKKKFKQLDILVRTFHLHFPLHKNEHQTCCLYFLISSDGKKQVKRRWRWRSKDRIRKAVTKENMSEEAKKNFRDKNRLNKQKSRLNMSRKNRLAQNWKIKIIRKNPKKKRWKRKGTIQHHVVNLENEKGKFWK